MVEIHIGRMATTLRRLELEKGSTLEDALEAASDQLNLGPKNTEEIVVNGDSVDGDYVLQNGDTIMFVQSVAGAL